MVFFFFSVKTEKGEYDSKTMMLYTVAKSSVEFTFPAETDYHSA